MLDALRDSRVSDEFVVFLNPRVVFKHINCRDDRINLIGMSILNRLHAHAGGFSASSKEAVLGEFSIGSFASTPLSKQQFRRLFSLGMLTRWCILATEHGALLDEMKWQASRVLLVPHDSQTSDLGMAISSLLTCEIHVDASCPRELTFAFDDDGLQCEPSTACGIQPQEQLQPYILRLDTERRCVTLVEDTKTTPMPASDAISVDDVQDVPYDTKRTRRGEVQKLFPSLASRLHSLDGTSTACFMEVQARRTTVEWSLDGLDSGKNLSSLGMSILLAISLGGWYGARVRVFIGRTRAAALGFWSGDGFRLVDPVRTNVNAYDVAPYVSCLPESGKNNRIYSGVFVQVPSNGQWRVAKVVRLSGLTPDTYQQMEVLFLSTGKKVWISLKAQTWRRLARRRMRT